jgi:hypothetical protein
MAGCGCDGRRPVTTASSFCGGCVHIPVRALAVTETYSIIKCASSSGDLAPGNVHRGNSTKC